ncbi:hypothetical protein IZY60_11440 [Lutibacter sp. B2]|nr:hypothetical protein [Lutibacter sp. B2]
MLEDHENGVLDEEVEVSNVKDLEKKEQNFYENIISSLSNKDILLPIAFLMMLTKAENKSFVFKNEYLGDKLKGFIAESENMIDMFQQISKYLQNQKELESDGRKLANENNKKPIELLEVIKPYVHTNEKDKIDKVLKVNEKIGRLKDKKNTKRNMIEDVENITEILETLKVDKGVQVRKALDKAKDIMQILNR